MAQRSTLSRFAARAGVSAPVLFSLLLIACSSTPKFYKGEDPPYGSAVRIETDDAYTILGVNELDYGTGVSEGIAYAGRHRVVVYHKQAQECGSGLGSCSGNGVVCLPLALVALSANGICHASSDADHCAALEFTAEPGECYRVTSGSDERVVLQQGWTVVSEAPRVYHGVSCR